MIGNRDSQARRFPGAATGWTPSEDRAILVARAPEHRRRATERVVTATIRKALPCERCGESVFELEVERDDGSREIIRTWSDPGGDGLYVEHECAPASEHRS